MVELSARDTLSRTLQNVGKEAENAGRKAEDAGKRATRSTADWSRAASALGLAIGAGLGAAIKISNEAEVVQARLRTSIENTGHAYDEYADAIDKASDASLKLAFDDEDAANAIAALTDATGDAQTAINDLAIAQDIARGRGIDLAAATQIVIAAETGRFQSLKRLGIAVDENATKEEVLASLQAKYAGQAEAYAKTNSATWDRIGNSVENTLESIGGTLADFQGPLIALSAAGAALGPLGDAFDAIDGKAKLARASSAALTLALSPAGLAVGALGAAAGITYLINQMNRYDDAAETAARSTLDLSNFFKSLAASVDPANRAILTDLNKNLDQIISDAAQRQSDLDKLLTLQLGITNAGIDISTDAAAKLAAETTGLTVDQLKWIDTNHDLSVSIDEVNAAVTLFQTNLDRLNADQVEKVQADIKSLFSKSNLDYEKAAAAVQDLNRQLDQGLLTPEQYVAAIADLAQNYGDLIRGMADDTEEVTIRMRRSWGGATLEITGGIQEQLQAFQDWRDGLNGTGHAITDNIDQLVKQKHAMDGAADGFNAIDHTAVGAASGLTTNATAASSNSAAVAALDDQLDALASTLKADLPGAASAAYNRVVGFTSGMVGAIKTSKDWADALIAPVGTFSELDNMLANGQIDLEDYNEAQQAQIDITNDLARATAASNEIQVKQADTVADGAKATADYLETLADMPEAQQAVALAWADTDVAGQAMQVANLAAEFGTMNTAQQEAFSQMVTSAAATNPALAAVLVDLGLIQESASDPTGYTLTIPTDGAQASIQDVVDAIDRLTNAILGIPDATVTVTADTSSFYNTIGGIPQVVGDRYINVHGVGFTMATGGVVGAGHLHGLDTAALGRVSAGNLTLVGEHGPELVNLPGGSFVTPNHATRYDDRARGGGGLVINELHIHGVQNPKQFMDWQRQYSSAMERQ